MTTETTHKIRKALFKRFSILGLTDTRHDVVFNFTGGRTSSTRELKPWEMAELVEKLGGPKFSEPDDFQWGMFDGGNKQHLYILSLCYQYGWTIWNNKLHKTVADIERLGRWLKHYSTAKKPLANQDSNELHTTIFQLEQMIIKHYK